ncbi:hypothetical protein MRB53_014396 [Persea americana]|uniref:Uncharacterized protein n=1 Tax=Persea americana TaxID=3435 RepID=A0ACC2KAR1_PERAE|nr:hypothetical protein MRB53_014396 [Persea americana]
MAKGGRHSRSSPCRRSSTCTLVLSMLLMLSLVLLILLALGIVSLPINTASDSPSAVDLNTVMKASTDRGEELGGERKQWTEIISWEPRAFVYHNFLSKDECEYLIELAKPNMVKSTVVDSATGQSKDSRVRTSSGTFLTRGRDKTIRNIEKRIADFTFMPAEHGEGLQILHYEVGQKYEPHYDYFLDEFNTKNGGQRIATVLMYLSDVEEGGETVFPSAKGNFSAVPCLMPLWIHLACMVVALSLKEISGLLQNGFVSTIIMLNPGLLDFDESIQVGYCSICNYGVVVATFQKKLPP